MVFIVSENYKISNIFWKQVILTLVSENVGVLNILDGTEQYDSSVVIVKRMFRTNF